jgi:hypothetical protein
MREAGLDATRRIAAQTPLTSANFLYGGCVTTRLRTRGLEPPFPPES